MEQIKILNLKETMLSVPVKEQNGNIKYLNLRLQGRNGQDAPVISASAVTPGMELMQKKGFIKLQPV